MTALEHVFAIVVVVVVVIGKPQMHERRLLAIATIINPNLGTSYCFKVAHNVVHTMLQTRHSGDYREVIPSIHYTTTDAHTCTHTYGLVETVT